MASTLTHPWVYFAWPAWWPGSALSGLLTAEAFAIAGEAWWLGRHGVHMAVAWATFANVLSAALGLGCRAWLGWP
ncbi:MAG: hypothetical protein ACE366_22390 [Bradymonadia bacterium]